MSATTAVAAVFPDSTIPQNSRSGANIHDGLKKALYLVVHDLNDPFTTTEWSSRVTSIRSKELATRDFYAENSGGKFDIYYADVIDAGIALNADGTRPSNFWSLANTVATNAGKNLSDYYMFSYDVDDTQPDSGQGWAGLSTSNRIYLQSTSQNVINHEIGHQVGADHAKAFLAQNDSTFHTYTWNKQSQAYQAYIPGTSPYNAIPFGVASYEYANPFDTMGNTSGGDFRIREKVSDLTWIPSSQFPRLDGVSGLGAGSYKIYAHDELQSTTNVSGNYGVVSGYAPNVYYGLTYNRSGQSFNTSTHQFVADTQTVDIEYRSNADGAYFYLDGVLVDLDSSTSNLERLLEVGRSIEDTEFGLSTFIVDAGAVGSTPSGDDFLTFNPPPPAVVATNWFHFLVAGTGVDSIGSYINITVSSVNALNNLAGDLNQDGFVNSTDLNLFVSGWRSNTSTLSSINKYSKGDMNFDGSTNLSDAHLFRQAWSAAGGASLPLDQLFTGVPEPSSFTLLLAAVIGCLAVSRRRSPTAETM